MLNKQPLVSVVCPAYNSARYLRETLGSVFSQTYRNWELVIADDGSSDETIDIVKTFCGHRQPVRIISLPHSGVPAVTRNAAAFAAQGEFLAFLDSDDSWCPTKLERQIQSRHVIPVLCLRAIQRMWSDTGNTGNGIINP